MLKRFLALAFMLTLTASFVGMETHAEAVGNSCAAIKLDDHAFVHLSGKAKYRCKICGKTFNTGLVMAGHIRGNHNKILIHKYYEKI